MRTGWSTAQSRLALAAVGLVVLTLAVLGAALRGPLEIVPRGGTIDPRSGEIATLAPMPTPTDEQTDELGIEGVQPTAPVLEIPSWVAWVAGGLALLFVVTLLVLILRAVLARDSRTQEFDEDVTGEASAAPAPLDLTAPLADAAQALRSCAAPRDAVQAAWVALEQRASAAHLARGASQTPTEFASRLTGATAADPDAVDALRRLYLAARFGEHPVGAESVAAAQAALDRIGATWRDSSERPEAPQTRSAPARDRAGGER
ncbi:DUF4129 domain-containing protein [Serinibacter salmoneus]|uniref:Uncharacterized protein DUF4129 n=1 Tax=Serinibacter salmoneus TaxID=556530 RepID=A0A2A9CZN9_9MICO|nr:DUF4129 domain-containing protein [Serinibacter salmoneus]PFG19162.1 uncharacterized protein DUF4129 [Serinibacter salmoneus]